MGFIFLHGLHLMRAEEYFSQDIVSTTASIQRKDFHHLKNVGNVNDTSQTSRQYRVIFLNIKTFGPVFFTYHV